MSDRAEMKREPVKPYELRLLAAAKEFARTYFEWQQSLKTCQDDKSCASRCNKAVKRHFRARDVMEKASNRFVTAERRR